MSEISIIVPVYKAEKYLRACIESILEQTYTDFELILVDDGSPDNSGTICDEYAKRDHRVRVIHQKNQGQAAARNFAVAQAKGQWVCFVDSDDLIHPQMLEALYEAAMNNHASISMCAAVEAEEIPGDFWKIKNAAGVPMELNEPAMEALYNHGEHRGWVVWGKLIRKEIIKKIPFTAGRVFEDNAVVCQWLVEAKKVADVDERLYFYRINTVGTTKSGFQIKSLDYLWALEQMINFFDKTDFCSLRTHFLYVFLLTALDYHRRVRDELQQPDLASGIMKQMRKLSRKYRAFFSLPYEQKVYIYSVMYPRIAKLYWIAKAAKTALKQEGVLGFLKKIFGCLGRGVSK